MRNVHNGSIMPLKMEYHDTDRFVTYGRADSPMIDSAA